MGYRFPDAREAFFVLLADRGEPYFQLTVDFQANLPAILIYRIGGSEDGTFREDRILVDYYAVGSDAANDGAEDIKTFLADSWHEATIPARVAPPRDAQVALLDYVNVETLPTEMPYASDTVNLVSATYRVGTRGL